MRGIELGEQDDNMQGCMEIRTKSNLIRVRVRAREKGNDNDENMIRSDAMLDAGRLRTQILREGREGTESVITVHQGNGSADGEQS